MKGLSASELADLAGVTEAEVGRLVHLGVLEARHGPAPFLEADVPKVRLATACEQAGLPMAGIAAAIRADRLPFAFLEAMGSARMAPDEPMREDEPRWCHRAVDHVLMTTASTTAADPDPR
jgi:hypothetical protein